jgi:hypothetical protein
LEYMMFWKKLKKKKKHDSSLLLSLPSYILYMIILYPVYFIQHIKPPT